MDHRERHAEHKRHEREEHHRHAVAAERRDDLRRADGPRRITPIWFAALGFVLMLVALLRWMALF